MPIKTVLNTDVTTISGQLLVQTATDGVTTSTTSLDSGKITTDGAGNITVVGLQGLLQALPQNTGTAPTLASSGTIATAGLTTTRVTTGGAVTGVILAAGTKAGQVVMVVNESANSITMAAAATSNVQSGTTNVIPASAGAIYVWDSLASTPVWVCVARGV